VVTVEHLAGRDGALHPVQQAMVDFHGSQCGFCTPGFVMSLYGLWLSNGTPTRADIESALQGNLCRCTGYEPIVKAAEHISVNRPSSLFDPLERDRIQIMAKLWGIHSGNDTTIITKDGARSIVPASVAAFADILADEPEATIVAGATDVGLWVTKQMRLLNPVIFINHLTELQSITSDETGITIGAGVSYTQAFDVLSDEIPAFGRLIDRIGGQQVRNMGTIGGNIANGSPIGDTPPPLIALGAELTLRSHSGRRTIALEDYFLSYGKQDRLPTEFVEKVFVPRPAEGSHFAVYKISKRRTRTSRRSAAPSISCSMPTARSRPSASPSAAWRRPRNGRNTSRTRSSARSGAGVPSPLCATRSRRTTSPSPTGGRARNTAASPPATCSPASSSKPPERRRNSAGSNWRRRDGQDHVRYQTDHQRPHACVAET
jgi:xanthine dehydrogenase small subunit